MNIEVKNSVKPVDYRKSIQFLEERVKEVISGKKKELLWILEHNTVYTAGARSSNNEILNKNIKLIKTNRGGKITVHSPGQKIVYFVLNLNKRKKNIRKLINDIENCIINILRKYKIRSFADSKNIGIWVGKKNNAKKIAAIGIRVSKWVAYHGFSLNISNSLIKYNDIVPCGIKNKGVTSLKELKIRNYKDINNIIIKEFLNIFL
jgi:lipoyl(octanoyl) transferase